MIMMKAAAAKMNDYNSLVRAIRRETDFESQMSSLRSSFSLSRIFRLLLSCFRE